MPKHKDIARSDEEINDLLNEVSKQIQNGCTRFRGMTFEQGIRDALEWVIGDIDDYPYPES